MATTTGPAVGAGGDLRLTPETYTTVDTLIKTTKDLVMPDLVESYGEQGITGFLKLTGAVMSGGASDQVDWYEAGRRHSTTAFTGVTENSDELTFTVSATNTFQLNDVFMDSNTGVRYIVTGGVGTASLTAIALSGDVIAAPSVIAGDLIHLGNMYAQGSDQPTRFLDPSVSRKKNPFFICKDRYQVNGSQATNIGWVNIGGGEYRWFMYGEGEARKRFEDRREMMMLFGEQNDGGGATALASDIAGSDGYVTAVQAGGINVTNANANPIDSISEFDDIIVELDKQGAPSEYAMYLARKQDLAIDDMLASGIATSVTAGLSGQFGAFNNDADMAVKLGFKSFSRGGYTFHKHDWKLLNDPTLLGATNYLQGAMVPMSQVADAKSGKKSPSLAMYYKEANGYSRELDHWVTGGGVLGYNNNGDKGSDVATFHYRSECALVTRAANQHVLIRG